MKGLKIFSMQDFISAKKYFQMPELNKFEDYESCLETYESEARYCYVRTAIKPDTSSELYNFIKSFSDKKKQHFRHDKLTRGVCINTCKNLISELGTSADDFYLPEFKLDYKVRKALHHFFLFICFTTISDQL